MDLNVSGQHIGYFRHEINFCSRKLSEKKKKKMYRDKKINELGILYGKKISSIPA